MRADRLPESGKKHGGGLCFYINEKWCNNATVRYQVCCPDVEMLTVNVRPFYLPREFSQIYLCIAYCPPKSNVQVACDIVADHIHSLQARSPDAAIVIMGDFNACTLDKSLPDFHQYVTCPTREQKTIDLCYANVPNAYLSRALPALGKSDHSMVQLMPVYRQRVRREKPKKITVKRWSPEAVDTLRACFDCTSWDVLVDGCNSIDEAVEVTTDYIRFCESICIPEKTIKCFPNNKPWVDSSLKEMLNGKKHALKHGTKEDRRRAQDRLRTEIEERKKNYREKLESLFDKNDYRGAWEGLQKITGYKPGNTRTRVDDEQRFSNDLNKFYARFDSIDYSENTKYELEQLDDHAHGPEITTAQVRTCFKRINPRKSCGPDNISGRILRECCNELAPVFANLFQKSLNTSTIPSMWKKSIIVPVPKKQRPATLNDYRPIALTSLIMKTFEQLVLQQLQRETYQFADPYQFAYRQQRSTEDAVLSLLHHMLQHLDSPRTSARILFVDFSSAFNTIQPHKMVQKLRSMNVNSNIIRWICSFLTNRTQCVRIGIHLSESVSISTGAPQGCALSPALFSLYTSDCRPIPPESDDKLFKYADDKALVGLIKNNDSSSYIQEVNNLVSWCDNNCLELNPKKTKEMHIDFRKTATTPAPLTIKGEDIEIVPSYKYLGVIIDNQLKWTENTTALKKKAAQRLYFLRKLRSFSVEKKIQELFYNSVVQSAISYCLACTFGNLSAENKKNPPK